MPLQKQPVQVVFGAVDQKTQAKQLTPGRPRTAQNVVQTKTGSYGKRGGFVATSRTTDTGSITAGKDLAIVGGVPVMRTADSVYARPASTWLKRGAYLPVVPSQDVVSAGRATHPLLVVVGTQNWNFVQGSDLKWYYSVTDSGIEVVSPTLVSSTAFFWGRAVSSTGKVWLFAGPPSGGGNAITLFQFATASPSTAPTSTTFASPTGVSVDAFDVIDAQANGNGIVAAIGSTAVAGIAFGGTPRALFFGRLDTATGLVNGTGWVGDATIPVGELATPAAWVKTGQSATTLHFLSRHSTNNHVYLSAVTAASLACTTTDLGAPVLTPGAACSVTAYRDTGSGNIVIFATDSTSGTSTATITKATWNGAALTSNGVLARARLTVADPFLMGGVPYLICQMSGGTSSETQAGYYLLDASSAPGRVVARVLYGLGALAAQPADALGSLSNAYYLPWICPVVTSGNRAFVLVGSFDGTAYTLVRLTFDFASTLLGPPATSQDDQLLAFPGGWPMALAGGGSLADVAPGMFPDEAFASPWTVTPHTASSSLEPGSYECTICYAVIDSRGDVQRSSPAPKQTVTIASGEVIRFGNVPSLRVGNTGVSQVFVEYYITDPDEVTPFLVRRVANDPTADTIATQDVSAPARTGSEILYTEGGALEHAAAPPFTWAATWRNRIILGGTDAVGAEVWPSFELTPGFGPAWSEVLRFRLPDGAGKDIAGCQVDFNYFAIFKADSVWVISGAGPDPVGTGGYGDTIQQVPGAPGCTDPRSVVSTPLGAMYQATSGQIWLIGHGGAASYIGEGWTDHESATVVAAVHSPHHELVLFFLSTGVALVWDYGNPLPEQGAPLGQSYVWTLPATAVAAAVSGASLYYLDATGVMRTYTPGTFSDDGSAAILRKLVLPLNLGGIRGHQRLYRGQVVGQYVSGHQLKVTWTTFAGAAGETGSTSQSWTRTVSGGPELFEFRPDAMKHAVAELTLEDVGTDLVEAASWDGLALEVGVRPGLPRIGTGQRLT
jgi:hypothetical protein